MSEPTNPIAVKVRFLRGNRRANDAYTGPIGEMTIDFDDWHIRLHDGITPGGHVISNQSDLQTAMTQVQQSLADIDPTFDRYDVAVNSTTGSLDLSASQVFTVNVTSNRTISFNGAPPASRAMPVVINLIGSNGTVSWPNTIQWDNNQAPELGNSFTVVALLWTGSMWIGSVSAVK